MHYSAMHCGYAWPKSYSFVHYSFVHYSFVHYSFVHYSFTASYIIFYKLDGP